ncbi:hypothetical protein GQ42DRAFT_16818 [Ramicandelaber brevisporus]|nr:hypothetical protein GQ42DRAFT_16818 [Ramicandelaber brevisporus]
MFFPFFEGFERPAQHQTAGRGRGAGAQRGAHYSNPYDQAFHGRYMHPQQPRQAPVDPYFEQVYGRPTYHHHADEEEEDDDDEEDEGHEEQREALRQHQLRQLQQQRQQQQHRHHATKQPQQQQRHAKKQRSTESIKASTAAQPAAPVPPKQASGRPSKQQSPSLPVRGESPLPDPHSTESNESEVKDEVAMDIEPSTKAPAPQEPTKEEQQGEQGEEEVEEEVEEVDAEAQALKEHQAALTASTNQIKTLTALTNSLRSKFLAVAPTLNLQFKNLEQWKGRPPPQPQPFKIEGNGISAQFGHFTADNRRFLEYEDKLGKVLLELDGVDSLGDENLRIYRKAVVGLVQSYLAELDAFGIMSMHKQIAELNGHYVNTLGNLESSTSDAMEMS